MIAVLSSYYFIEPILQAFEYRWRGMAHSWGDTVNRITSWAIPRAITCTALAYTYNLPLWLGIPCGLMAFAAVCIGHASEQGSSDADYEHMGYLCGLMMAMMLLPFWVYFGWSHSIVEHRIFFVAPIVSVPLGVLASWLGYNKQYALNLFGISWTQTGNNSTCEEMNLGFLPMGLVFSAVGLYRLFY